MNNIKKLTNELAQYIGDKLCREWQLASEYDNACKGCPYYKKCRPSFNALKNDIEDLIINYLVEEK